LLDVFIINSVEQLQTLPKTQSEIDISPFLKTQKPLILYFIILLKVNNSGAAKVEYLTKKKIKLKYKNPITSNIHACTPSSITHRTMQFRHWFYVLQTYTKLYWSTSGENYFLTCYINDTNLTLRFISYDRSKFFIQLKYPKSERFNVNYVTYIFIKCAKYFDN
jgi:hypothetical protein